VAEEAAEVLLERLREKGSDQAAIIGRVMAEPRGRIWVH